MSKLRINHTDILLYKKKFGVFNRFLYFSGSNQLW